MSSRQALQDYALRRLGEPVIQVNIDQSQMDDCINDALTMFHEFHHHGSERVYIPYLITQDIKTNKRFIIPDEVTTIIRILPISNNPLATTNLQYQAFITDVISSASSNGTHGGAVSNWIIAQSYIDLINDIFNTESEIRFNRYISELRIQTNWDKLSLNDYIVAECFIRIDPDRNPKVWTDRWLRDYTTALFHRQWGMNIGKYKDVTLPSGLSLNGAQILEMGMAEVLRQEEILKDKYTDPTDFFIG